MNKVLASDGVSLAFHTSGDGDIAVVLIHPWGASATGGFWDPVVAGLSPQLYRTIQPDLRGHGSSDAGGAYSLVTLADDIQQVMKASGVTRAVIVGHSVGARLAQFLACAAPDRVHALVLVAPAPAVPLPLPDELLSGWMSALARAESWRTVVDAMTKAPIAEGIFRAFAAQVRSAHENGLRGLFDLCRQGDFSAAVSAIHCRTLIVAGAADPSFPVAMVTATCQHLIPDSHLLVADAGHFVPLEQPAFLAAVIDAFSYGSWR